jgi:hypothetical protein
MEKVLMSGITIGGKHLSRRTVTIIWVAVLAAVVIFFLYKSWIAQLYVLATLGVTALMIIVARADLSGAKKPGSGMVEDEVKIQK